MTLLQSGLAKSLAEDYTIDNSLRFDNSGHLYKTFASAGDRKTWTFSCWMKKSAVADQGSIFGVDGGAPGAQFLFYTDGTFGFTNKDAGGSSTIVLRTTQVFRDPSAWQHFCLALDTTVSSPEADRVKLYINGSRVTEFSTATYPSEDEECAINDADKHSVGMDYRWSDIYDGYLAEVYFIDGTALLPSSFAELNETTNQWKPIDASGLTFGTNGFYQKYGPGPAPTVDSFTSTGSTTWTAPAGVTTVTYLVVAGGGGGGYGHYGGGGGAGGYRTSTLSVTPGTSYTVTVGGGGAGATVGTATGTNGSDSVFSTITSTGGGGGGSRDYSGAGVGADGGSGGGACVAVSSGGSAVSPTQGYAGGSTTDTTYGAGGGGAGAVGADGAATPGGAGGNGLSSSIDGSATTRGGGGGGGGWTAHASGGSGGGGTGGGSSVHPTAGAVNTGGGGGGGGYTGAYFVGAAGGSGIVILSYGLSFGNDYSGNDNDFAVTNLVATDQMVDTPTNNFCTWNPLDKDSDLDLSEGNTKCASSATGVVGVRSTFGMTDDKIYCEFMPQGIYAGYAQMGIETSKATLSTYPGGDAYGWGLYNLIIYTNNTNTTVLTGTTPVVNDIIQMAYNGTTGKVWFGLNNTWYTLSGNVGVPATDAYPHISGLTGEWFFAAAPDDRGGGHNLIANFGQDSSFAGNKTAQGNQDGNGKGDFYYAPPSGFLALCTDNLSAPEIALPGENFNTVLYTGDGATTQAITGVGFEPDFLWTKKRSATGFHALVDSVRGATNYLSSNSTNIEYDDAEYITSLDSDGFTVGVNTVTNDNTETYVAWNWKAGGAPTADNDNTTGAMDANSVALNGSLQAAYTPEGSPTIYPTKMSINTTAGFSIIEYDGNSTAGATLPHGLTQAPDITFVKETTYVDNWVSFAEPLGNTKALFLDQNNAAGTHTTYWNDTSPSATVITLGTDGKANSSRPHIMYAFHSVEGYSKVGSYVGNANADGTFIYTGFKPAYALIKQYNDESPQGYWMILDNKRNTYNPSTLTLEANDSDDDTDNSARYIDFLSNGFKCRGTSTFINGSGRDYIYIAFAESPFKTSNAR